MRFSLILLTTILPWITLTACQPANGQLQISPEPAAQIDSPAATPESNTTPITLSTPEGSVMTPILPSDETTAKMIALVTQQLAKKLGIAADQILLKEVKPVVWRDAGLGCPKPSIDYIQVETPGFNILLEAGGQAYRYHTDQAKRFVLCNR